MKWVGWFLVALLALIAGGVALCMIAIAGIEPEEPPCLANMEIDACRKECFGDHEPRACQMLATITRDPVEVRTFLIPRCVAGEGSACDRVAALEVDFEKKKGIYAMGCAAPQSSGPCAKLAILEIDPAAQRAALEAGCLAGDVECCTRFRDIEHDTTKLRTLFDESCRRFPRNCVELADTRPDAGDGGSAH